MREEYHHKGNHEDKRAERQHPRQPEGEPQLAPDKDRQRGISASEEVRHEELVEGNGETQLKARQHPREYQRQGHTPEGRQRAGAKIRGRLLQGLVESFETGN